MSLQTELNKLRKIEIIEILVSQKVPNNEQYSYDSDILKKYFTELFENNVSCESCAKVPKKCENQNIIATENKKEMIYCERLITELQNRVAEQSLVINFMCKNSEHPKSVSETTKTNTRQKVQEPDVNNSTHNKNTDAKKASKQLQLQENKNKQTRNKNNDEETIGKELQNQKKINKFTPETNLIGTNRNTAYRNNNNKIIQGNSKTSLLKAVKRRNWIFVSRLCKETTTENVTDALKAYNIDSTECTKLEIR